MAGRLKCVRSIEPPGSHGRVTPCRVARAIRRVVMSRPRTRLRYRTGSLVAEAVVINSSLTGCRGGSGVVELRTRYKTRKKHRARGVARQIVGMSPPGKPGCCHRARRVRGKRGIFTTSVIAGPPP